MRFVECSVDPRLCTKGHIPDALCLDWETDLSDSRIRDIIGSEQFE